MIGVGRVRDDERRVRWRGAPIATGWFDLDLAGLDREAELPYWIAISLVPGVGPVGFARILAPIRLGSSRLGGRSQLLSCLPGCRPMRPGLRRLRRAGASAVARRVRASVQSAGGAWS